MLELCRLSHQEKNSTERRGDCGGVNCQPDRTWNHLGLGYRSLSLSYLRQEGRPTVGGAIPWLGSPAEWIEPAEDSSGLLLISSLGLYGHNVTNCLKLLLFWHPTTTDCILELRAETTLPLSCLCQGYLYHSKGKRY